MRISIRGWAILLPLLLAGCGTDEASRSLSFTDDRGVANQPFPSNYRAEITAFMRTYLNNPVGVHDAAMADPMQRTIGGRLRYVSCLRYAVHESDGSYQAPRERAIVYVDGRLDRLMESPGDACTGAAYAPFPELGAMTR